MPTLFNRSLSIGLFCILISCLLFEQIHESIEKNKAIKAQELSLLISRSSLSGYFQAIDTELKSAANDPRLIHAMHELSQAWSGLDETERNTLHILYQSHKSSNEVKQAYIEAERLKDMHAFDSHLQNTNNGFAQYQTSVYDTAAHFRTKIRPELQYYLDYNTKFQPYSDAFISHFDYYDLFLIDIKGNIVYSHAFEDDYATNLKEGPYKSTELGRLYRNIVWGNHTQTTQFSEFDRYGPSGNLSAMFSGHPIMHEGKLIGLVALQVNANMLDKVMAGHSDLNSGNTFLIDDNYQVINTQYALNELNNADAILDETLKTAIENTKKTETNSSMSNGLLVSYTPLKLNNRHWFMMSELDANDLLTPVRIRWILTTLLALLVFGIAHRYSKGYFGTDNDNVAGEFNVW